MTDFKVEDLYISELSEKEVYRSRKGENPTVLKQIDNMVTKRVDKGIIEGMLMQQQWVLLMDPAQALLKFRLPYKLNEQVPNSFDYLVGEVYWQIYQGKQSTETRLKPIR